ncbi:MAG: UDP-N-acetylmuramate dehydrogenase [Chloroflexi bacterium]|nr:UDP-N-acetylmuramate dehydrogenase [Chloroflexota bacterium]
MIKHEHFPLSAILYYRIGGTARFLLEASSVADVFQAVEFVRANAIERLMVVGLGSNLLFPDGLFDGCVLRMSPGPQRQVRELGKGLLGSFAGEELDHVITFGFDRGYSGLEWAGGLPGTVGAAVRGNVGAFGGELKDVLETAEVLEMGEAGPTVRSLTNSDLNFAYRDSLVKQDRRLVVVSATFRLSRPDADALQASRESYRANIEYRHRNHPMEYPTCGSVFKNIKERDEVERMVGAWPDLKESVEGRWHGKVSMGYAINRLGLRGYRLGGAEISSKHSNFIVNLGDATFSDVHGIIRKVQERFFETFGFLPEPEVEIVGEQESSK